MLPQCWQNAFYFKYIKSKHFIKHSSFFCNLKNAHFWLKINYHSSSEPHSHNLTEMHLDKTTINGKKAFKAENNVFIHVGLIPGLRIRQSILLHFYPSRIKITWLHVQHYMLLSSSIKVPIVSNFSTQFILWKRPK